MSRFRFPFIQTIKTRNGSLNKDAKIVNGYTEANRIKHVVVKRPGTKLLNTLPGSGGLSAGQGAYDFLGDTVAIVENKVYKVHFNGVYELIGTISGTINQCYFTQSGSITVPDLYYTSTLYPVESSEGYGATSSIPFGSLSPSSIEGYSVTYSAPISGILYVSVVPYNNYASEGYGVTSSALVGGAFGTVSNVNYNNYAPEGYSTTASSLVSGTLIVTVIPYNNYIPEGFVVTSSTLISGTLG